MSHIRLVTKEDIPHLRNILDSVELFPSEMLADMIQDYLENPESEDIWFTAEDSGTPISIGYCTPEILTEGTFNLIAIGVKEDLQSKGIGSKMIHFLEDLLRTKGSRILIVETSGGDDFIATRHFYEKLGYTKEAEIRDFWKEGESKVIYWKKL